MTSADRLRQAATVLRERAEAQAVIDREYGPARIVMGSAPSRLERLSVEFGLMWSPPVALALADWLDIHADYEDTGENARDEFLAALTVANAILGTTP